jgi:hypothetical protein
MLFGHRLPRVLIFMNMCFVRTVAMVRLSFTAEGF